MDTPAGSSNQGKGSSVVPKKQEAQSLSAVSKGLEEAEKIMIELEAKMKSLEIQRKDLDEQRKVLMDDIIGFLTEINSTIRDWSNLPDVVVNQGVPGGAGLGKRRSLDEITAVQKKISKVCKLAQDINFHTNQMD